MKANFIVLEGPDFSGKTTQAVSVAKAVGSLIGAENVVLVRDPGGTTVGDTLRPLLKDAEIPLDPHTEFLLFLASRSALIEEVIKPAIEEDKVVISDRYIMSNLVYQGGWRRLGRDYVEAMATDAARGCLPDACFVMCLDDATLQSRMSRSKRILTAGDRDRFDRNNMDVLEFNRLYRREVVRSVNYTIVDGNSEDRNKITQEIMGRVRELLGV